MVNTVQFGIRDTRNKLKTEKSTPDLQWKE